MDRLVQRLAAAGGVGRAERGRGEQAERARQHRRLVRQDVAEQVVGDDHVEFLGRAQQLHGERVGVHVLKLHVGVLLLVQLGRLFAPQHAGVHHVGLLRGEDLVLALAGQFEGDGADAADFRRRVALRVEGLDLAGGVDMAAARLAEVNAAGQFADDHDVEALDDLGLQRGGIDQRVEHLGRAQVGEEVHLLAQAQQAALGLLAEIGGVPLRAADRTEQHGIGLEGGLHGVVAERHAVLVERGATDQVLGDVEADRALLAHPGNDLADFVHHLGADAVAGQHEQIAIGRHDGQVFRWVWNSDRFGRSSVRLNDLILRSAAFGASRRMGNRRGVRCPSFETLAALAPQDEVGGLFLRPRRAARAATRSGGARSRRCPTSSPSSGRYRRDLPSGTSCGRDRSRSGRCRRPGP